MPSRNSRSTPHRPRPTKRALDIVEDLSVGETGLAEIAARHNLNVASLARWAARPQSLRLLEQARDLSLLRATLVAARARTEAALSLRRVALDHQNPETARKACADLLRLCAQPDEIRADFPRFEPENREDAIRRLMERLGTQR